MLIGAFLFLIMLCVAKSKEDFETTCKSNYTDLNNTPIDVLKYCSNNLCIEKCCRAGEIIFVNDNKCINIENFFKGKLRIAHLKSKIIYSTNILSFRNETKKSKYKFALVHNNRDVFKCNARPTDDDDTEYYISEDGSLTWQDSVSKIRNKIGKLKYCADYKLVSNPSPDIKFIFKQNTANPLESEEIETLEIVVLLISSFFLMLVLVVYCLLPNLRNLSGLVLMAYTFTLLFAFVNKLIQTFIKNMKEPPKGFCKKFSPVVYFGFISSIFWLSVLSFDLWWGLRSFRYRRGSKRSELVKFMWYGLYAWGTPLLLTAIVITLDNNVVYLKVEPPFKDCLQNGESFDFYYKIPVGILIFINFILFVLTVYNIWLVKRAVDTCQDSRSSKQQTNKFATYSKLSVMMGLSWCLELLPAKDLLWYYILNNLYNLLTGVIIFYWFVCKKTILVQLCKKFKIQNDFTKKLETELLSRHTKIGITRTTGVSSSIVKKRSNKEEIQEMDVLKNCPKEENTTV